MAPTHQGTTTITDNGKSHAFRFEICVTDENKLIVWIEDCESKRQWQTGPLSHDAFVTVANAMPATHVPQYAEWFAKSLEACGPLQAARPCAVLQNAKTGSDRVLTLTLPLAFVQHSVEYQFSLQEVTLDRVELLSARVRDLEAAALAAQATTSEPPQPVYAQATTVKPFYTNEMVVWEAGLNENSPVVEFGSVGGIHFTEAGVYSVYIGVRHSSCGDEEPAFELYRGNERLVSCEGYTADGVITTTLHYLFKAQPSDNLRVVYTGDGETVEGCYLTVVRL